MMNPINHMMSPIDHMLALQANLQRDSYGKDLKNLGGEHKMQAIRDNVLALTDELHEAMAETGWKPWSTSHHMNEEAFKGELVDAWHFFMNLMLIAGMDEHELVDGYLKKHETNAERQRVGYDGVSTKCPRCKRALDDPATQCKPHDTELPYCMEYGSYLNEGDQAR